MMGGINYNTEPSGGRPILSRGCILIGENRKSPLLANIDIVEECNQNPLAFPFVVDGAGLFLWLGASPGRNAEC